MEALHGTGGKPNVDKNKLVAFLETHYQLIGVLVGALIVLASMGTYTNWDAEKEFEAAQSVVTSGFPYVSSGFMINQPPLAFYMTAPVLQAFGASYVNGVGFVSALGFGCVALVYALGTLLYGKHTGLVAAALFGLVPWQVFMARIYMIDAQYLFVSLLFLVVGVLAVHKNSEKLLAVSGVLFALAFLTKLFAIFFLVPLLLIVLLKGKAYGFKLTLRKALIFLVPSFIFQAIWFGGFANQNFLGVYIPADFTHQVLIANPSMLFLPQIFVESSGWFLLAAAIFSLALTLGFRHLFEGTLRIDVVCVGAILAVAAVDLSLVFGSHLLVPYVSAFKYEYAALPFLCLLAASLADKGGLLVSSIGTQKVKRFLVGLGLALLFASMVESAVFLGHFQPYTLIDFKVDYVGHYFPFYVYTSVSSNFQTWLIFAVALMAVSFVFPFVLRIWRKDLSKWNDIL